MNNIWIFSGILAAILLVIFWKGRNAVWGGLTLGIIIGILIAVFFAIKGKGFNFYTIGKTVIIGILVGFLAELLGKISDYLRRKT